MAVIVFRVDASWQIGNGHVMRCLTLADALRERDVQSLFICRPHLGNLFGEITHRGYAVLALPFLDTVDVQNKENTEYENWLGTSWFDDSQDTRQTLRNYLGNLSVDLLIVDHYSLDARWEQSMRPQSKRIMVIDDLADRRHFCELLLDQNLGRKVKDYDDLLDSSTIRLIGPNFALLRPQFAALRRFSLDRRGGRPLLRRLLISMGGVDKDNATELLLISLKERNLPADLVITVIMGAHAPWTSQVKSQATKMPWNTEVLIGIDNMHQIMSESDLAIGAAGGTAWERCCLGVPSLLLALSNNQLSGAFALQNAGAAIVFDSVNELVTSLEQSIELKSIDKMLKEVGSAAANVTDGDGCVRVANYIMNTLNA
jgi:UDP-2,4-diacetamido-2,4,6-trideoxy-beta-L-altropyranose hydrolase